MPMQQAYGGFASTTNNTPHTSQPTATQSQAARKPAGLSISWRGVSVFCCLNAFILLTVTAYLFRSDPVEDLRTQFASMKRDKEAITTELTKAASDLTQWMESYAMNCEGHDRLVFLHTKGADINSQLLSIDCQFERLSSSWNSTETSLNCVAAFYDDTASSLSDPDGNRIFLDMASDTRKEAKTLATQMAQVRSSRESIENLRNQLEAKTQLLAELIAFHDARSAVVVESTTMEMLFSKVHGLFETTRSELSQVATVIVNDSHDSSAPVVHDAHESTVASHTRLEWSLAKAPHLPAKNSHDPFSPFFSSFPGGPRTGIASGESTPRGDKK